MNSPITGIYATSDLFKKLKNRLQGALELKKIENLMLQRPPEAIFWLRRPPGAILGGILAHCGRCLMIFGVFWGCFFIVCFPIVFDRVFRDPQRAR